MLNPSLLEISRIRQIKNNFERAYPEGQFVIQEMHRQLIVELPVFTNCFIAWESQRPDQIFSDAELLFNQYMETYGIKEVGDPENIYALNGWLNRIHLIWAKDNPYGLSNSLFAAKEHAIYFHLYAISRCFAIHSYQTRFVPRPISTYQQAFHGGATNYITRLAAKALNHAFNQAMQLPLEEGEIFDVENWFRSKESLRAINGAVEEGLKEISKLPFERRVPISNALKIKGADVKKAIAYTTSGEHLSRKA
ncbi:MAG: hypothetical protein V4536_02795 [Pseudomonadota bacterium]